MERGVRDHFGSHRWESPEDELRPPGKFAIAAAFYKRQFLLQRFQQVVLFLNHNRPHILGQNYSFWISHAVTTITFAGTARHGTMWLRTCNLTGNAEKRTTWRRRDLKENRNGKQDESRGRPQLWLPLGD